MTERNTRQKQRRSVGRVCCLLLAFLLNAVCLLVWMETIARGGKPVALYWLMERTSYALMSAGGIALAEAFFVFLWGKLEWALLTGNGLFLLLAVVQNLKLRLRGEPFFPRDLAMIGEAMGVSKEIFNGGVSLSKEIWLGLILMGIMVPLLFTGIRVMQGKRYRRLVGALLLLGCCVGYANQMASTPEEAMTIMQDDYVARGLLIAWTDRLPWWDEAGDGMNRPETYSEETVHAILKDVPAPKTWVEQPDILFIMNESLFDMTRDLTLSEEPMPYLKQLQKEYGGGEALTASYGGGTANVEYEVLTGYRTSDSVSGYPFTRGNMICQGMDSVVSVLKEYGYATQAIHPNEGTFYNRERAYTTLGFDQRFFSDQLPTPPKEEFPFPSDAYLYEQIIQIYESRSKDQPWFCHAVTYQNHASYGFDSDLSVIEVENDLSETEKKNAKNYVNLLRLSDEALQKLIAYFDAQERPVVILLWGDHAPAVQQFGVNLPEGAQAQMAYYSTPYFVYSNFGLDTQELPERISTYRLGAYVLHLLGMDEDAYFRYLSDENTPNLTGFTGLIEENGQYVFDEVRYAKEQERLKILHYDRLIGEQYGKGM